MPWLQSKDAGLDSEGWTRGFAEDGLGFVSEDPARAIGIQSLNDHRTRGIQSGRA